jgi:hypothetical protein
MALLLGNESDAAPGLTIHAAKETTCHVSSSGHMHRGEKYRSGEWKAKGGSEASRQTGYSLGLGYDGINAARLLDTSNLCSLS